MRKTTLMSVIVVLVLAVVGFAGGAVTYAELSDTETAEVSVVAGTWTTTPTETVCPPGTTVTYHVSGNNGFVHRDGPDILRFSNRRTSRRHQIISAEFTSTQPITEIMVSHGSFTETKTFDPPVTSGTITNDGIAEKSILAVTATCGGTETTSVAPTVTSAETTGETPSTATETVTETPETEAPTPTPTPTPTETETTTEVSVDANHPLEDLSSGNETTETTSVTPTPDENPNSQSSGAE